jgi:hypothetical protein
MLGGVMSTGKKIWGVIKGIFWGLVFLGLFIRFVVQPIYEKLYPEQIEITSREVYTLGFDEITVPQGTKCDFRETSGKIIKKTIYVVDYSKTNTMQEIREINGIYYPVKCENGMKYYIEDGQFKIIE